MTTSCPSFTKSVVREIWGSHTFFSVFLRTSHQAKERLQVVNEFDGHFELCADVQFLGMCTEMGVV